VADPQRSAGIDGARDPVEELPPQLERARDGAPHVGLERGRRRQPNDDVVADGAVLAVGLLVSVPERDLAGRAAVVPLQRPGKGPNAPGTCPSAARLVAAAPSMNGRSVVERSNQSMSAAVVASGRPPTMSSRDTPTLSPKRMNSSGCNTLQPEIRPVSSS
jgi:hypothetical protein